MSDVNAIINIDINSSSALVNLKRLESQIDQFNRSVSTSNATAAAAQQSLNKALVDGINNTGLFTSKLVPVESSMTRFSRSLDEGRLSLGEYTKYASSQLPGLSRVFKKEFDTIEQVATSRVKSMQTQYVALGKTVDGITKTIASTPTGLGKGLATDLAMVQQRQQIFNKLLDDGSTKLLNWGKNTQWAGRQLMVGFSLPLAAFGAAASKTFMEIDKATISLKRVYGDLNTTKAELDSNVQAIKGLGKEYTKYGITLAQTIELSGRAAATGATNEKLMAATEQTLRFATLGQMDYNQALDTTISLQTAFGISNEDLGKTVDYLNAVENQTILTMEDMSLAIPRVATVVKGLGGNVQDLAVMMTAMREGGVSAENAANGLKSGLASLINPTKRASEGLAAMGINLNSIITKNKGDLMGIITEFGTAINKLDEFSRQQVLEQVFGKFQYARMSALFTNITKDAGQAARAMDIAGMSASELAKISEKELGQISESTSVKFQAAMEQLKISIAPIGEAFLKGITPIVNMVSKIADAFNNLPDGVKNSIAVITGVVAGLGPVFLMTIGLLGNGLANLTKGFQFFRKMIAGIKGDASAFTWLAQGELEAVTASKALENSSTTLTDKLLLQRGAVAGLTAEYERFAVVAGLAGARMGGMGGGTATRGAGGRRPLPSPRGFATGGIVPGTGNSDTIPALLTPGESVITKKATQKYAPILQQMNDGTLPGFAGGVTGLSRFLGRRTQFAHATGGRSVSGDEALRLLRPAERQLFQAPGSQSINATALSGLTIGVSDLENQALRVGVGKGLNPKEFSQRILDETLTPDLFKRLSLPKETRTDFRKTLSEEIEKIKKDPMFDDDLAKAFTRAEKRMVVKLKDKKELRDEFTSSIASSRQDAFTRLKFNIPENAPRVANVAEARTEAARSGLPTPTEPFYYYHAGQRKASALVRMPDGRIVGVQTDATRKVNPVQLAGGRVSIGRAVQSWQTSSRSVREDPEMLGALMSGMRPSQSARTLTRGTTLGLSRGSEFAAADEKMIMDALRSGNVDSLIGREFDMRGPISYTSGNNQGAINAMSMNTDVNRIRELKRQHAEAKQTHAARLKRIETLKKKIETGKGPISTYQAQLAELEGFVSMYAAGQKRRGREIKSLTSRGYEDLLIEQRFNEGDQLLDVNEVNPSGTFMGKDVSRESEFISSGSRVRVSGVTTDPNTGLTKLVLENIVDNVQRRASGGPIVPGSGSGDTVPAMLTPGEFVVNKQATQSNLGLLHAINNGQSVKKNKGGMIDGVQYLAVGDEVQSRRGGYKAPPQIARQTSSMPEWSTQNAEMLAARQAAEALGATTEQIDNNLNRVAAHLVEGQGAIKDWVANNLMTDLQAINQYMNRVPAVAKTVLKDTQMIDDIARQTGLSSSRVAKELDLLVKKVHPSTIEAASVLKHLSELDVQASIAVQNAREQARLSGTRVPSSRTSLGTDSEKGYLAAMAAATLREREKGDFYDTRGDRAYVTPEGGYQTRRGGADQTIPDVVSPTLSTSQQERDAYKELRRKNPTMAAQEALDKAKKQVMYDEAKQHREKYGTSLAASFAAIKVSRAAKEEEARNNQSQQRVEAEDVNIPSPEEERNARRQNRRSKIGRGLKMGGGAMMMASMAPMMMANEQGKVMGMDAGTLTGGLMSLGMLAEFAPLLMKLPPQIAIAGVAIAAVSAGFIIWRKNVDDAAKKTAELGANMGGTANALNNMATLLGTSTPNQRQAQMQLGFTAEQQQQAASQFQPMLESETGQKFIKDLESATSADRFKKLSDYLKAAIASGMMDTQSANVFAKTIASTLSDPVLGQSIIKSISGQKTGGAAMLGLAQNRESAVIAGGQLKTLGANKTVEETTASSVIGSSIQLIQDFSNAVALAKEEFVAGTISYSKYKNIIDQSTAAQEKYTQAIETSLLKTEDMGSTMLALKDQLILMGLSSEQQGALESALTRPNSSVPIGGGKESGDAFEKQIEQNKKLAALGITEEKVKAAGVAAVASGMNPAQVAQIAKEIYANGGGSVAQTFAKTNDYGLTGLQYNLQQNAVSGLAFTPNMTNQQKATIARGQQQYMGAAERFKGAGFSSDVFQNTIGLASDQNVPQMAAQLNQMDNQQIASTIKNIDELKSVIGPEGMNNIINVTLAENPPDLNKKLPELSRNLGNIVDNIPNDVQKALGINLTSNVDINEWGPLANDIGNLIPILDQMPMGVREFAMNVMVKKNGQVLDPKEFLDESLKINESFKNLSSKNLKVKKNAIIDLMTRAKGPNGEVIDDPAQAYAEMTKNIEDEFGKGKAITLNPDTYIKLITVQLQIEGLKKVIEGYKQLALAGGQVSPDRAEEAYTRLQTLLDTQSGDAGGDIAGAEINKKTGGSGGGGGSNPLLDLKKSILEQIKMYVDINATMKKLNDQKYKFADIIMGGQGVFDKLKSIKGIAGGFGANGLGSAAREAIMGMGPDAAKKWIKKNTTKNKKGQTVLTKKGQEEANQLEALSIKGTMTQNINAFESSQAQARAAVNLKRKGVSDNVVQSIAGDPEKAKILDFLQQQINNKIKGSKKLYWEFVNGEKAAIEQADLLARAQDPIQTQIDDMTLAHKKTTSEIDKQITIYQDQVDLINKEIEAIQELNSDDQNRIRNLDRQKEMINRDIEALSRKNELDQRSADALKREDEIRNRIADGLSHELDLMSEQETKIRDAYDKRVKALDEVAKINDYIINQQKSQLGLAQALSQGDVYAAAAAQQDMQAGTAQFAQEQMRSGLQTGMENQVAGLTTAGGLTRDQAEAQINTIKQQSYQTSLQIRDIEDAIYNRNLEMIPLKDSQLALDDQIRVIQDLIYGRETDIINIQDGKLTAAQSLLDKQVEIKRQLDKNFEQSVSDLELQNDLRKMSDAQANSVNALAMEYGQVANQLMRINNIAANKLQTLGGEPTKTVTETSADFEKRLKTWRDSVTAIETERAAASSAAVSNTPISGVSIPVAGSSGRGMLMATGGVVGTGGRDSIPAMLTPGEYVMRKASVQKYGMPMLSKMNMGAFDMPRYDTQQPNITSIQPTSNTANINAPVYNTYSVNVSANTNASADDIANTVMTKIKRVDSMAVRSFRGY